MYICEKCGSSNVYNECFAHLNTGEVMEGDRCYCVDCDDYVDVIETEDAESK